MCKSFAGTPIAIGGLFYRSIKVHTATQSRQSREMLQVASDKAIVARKFL